MKRTRFPFKSKRYKRKLTGKTITRINQVIDILNELKEYSPLTVRQIFYQFVSRGWIKNTTSGNVTIGTLLKFARIGGYIPDDCIEDRTRAKYDLTGWKGTNSFIDDSLDVFLTGYRRNLLQTQDVYLEIWIEKNALSSIFIKVAKQYTISISVTQNNSVSNLFEYRDRLQYHKHQQPVILFFSDFDPQGDNMLHAAWETLEHEMDVKGVQFKQIALCDGDMEKHDLFGDPGGIKDGKTVLDKDGKLVLDKDGKPVLKGGDKLAPRFRAKYGDGVVPCELDALPPVVLQDITRKAIESNIDMDLYHEELVKQEEDFSILKKLQAVAKETIKLKR